MKGEDFIARLKYLSTEKGGRFSPAFSRHRPHVEFDKIRGILTSGQQIFIGKDMVYPGGTTEAFITTIMSDFFVGKLRIGDTFSFSEGTRLIGKGKIVKFIRTDLNADKIPCNIITTEVLKRYESKFFKKLKLMNKYIQTDNIEDELQKRVFNLINDIMLSNKIDNNKDFQVYLTKYIDKVVDGEKTINKLIEYANMAE